MATASKRDVTLGVGIETTGSEGLKTLARDIRQLGDEGGPAAAKFAELATQVDRLAAQADSAAAVRQLSTEIDLLTAKQTEAAAAATAAAEALVAQRAAVDGTRQRQRELRDAVDGASEALRAAGRDIRDYRESQDAAARKTAEYREEIARLRDAQEQAQQTLTRARRALSDYGTEVATAVNRESQLAAAAARTGAAQTQATQAISQRSAALAQAQGALEAAGAATTDLAQAELDLLETQRRLTAEANDLLASQRESTEANERLAAAAREADRAYEQQVATLRETRAAADAYARSLDVIETAEDGAAAGARERVAAARALIESDRQLSQAQRDLAREIDVSRGALVAQAQALLAQERAAEASRAATARLVRETQSAADVLNSAFGTVGVRSLDAIEQEALAVERAVSLMERQFRAGAISAQDLARATGAATVKLDQLRNEASQIQALPGTFERLNSSLTGAINRFGALSAAIGTVAIAARPAIESIIALDQVRRVLTTVTGSADEASRQIEFLRVVAQRSGQSFDALAGSYAKFAASALQTGLSTQEIEGTFEAVAVAAGNLGLGTEQAKRALEALSQIASKGTVGMEELRQQLGDALPGVLPLLAKELGLTTRELNKLVESGNLGAAEAIPALRRALGAFATEGTTQVTGLVAEWNRLKSGLSEAVAIISDSTIGQALGVAAAGLGKLVGLLTTGVVVGTEFFDKTFKGIVAVVGILNGGGGLNEVWAEWTKLQGESDEKIAKLINRFGVFGSESDKVKASLEGQGTAAAGAAESMAKMNLRLTELQAESVTAAQNADKYAQSLRTLVTEAEQAAKSYVDQAAGQQLVADAQDRYVAGLDAQVAADQRVLDTLRQSKDELLARIAATGQQADAYKAQTDALDEKIAKADADLAKTRASAKAEDAKTEALRTSILALKDNSKEYDVLRKAVADAQAEFDKVNKRAQSNTAALGEVERAARNLREAKVKLKDASDDLTKALDRQNKLLESEAKLQTASIRAQIERLKVKQAEADLEKNEYASRQLAVKIKELEISLVDRDIRLSRDKANLLLNQIRLEREAALATGTLTDAMRDELQARENNARASLIEADAANAGSDALRVQQRELEIAAGIRGQLVGSLGGAASAYDKETDALDENTRARRENSRAAEAGSLGPNGATTGGATNPTRTTSGSTNPTRTPLGGGSATPRQDFTAPFQYTPPDDSGNWEFDVEAFNRAGGVNAGFDNNAVQQFWRRKGGGGVGTGITATAAPTAGADNARAVADETQALYGNQVAQMAAGNYELARQLGAFSAALNASAYSGRTVNVSVNLNGRTSNIPTTEAGAQELLRLLEEASRAAGGT